MRTQFFIVRNPNAGPENRNFYDSVLSRLGRLGCSAEIIETSRHGDGMKAAASAAASGRFDAVIAAGGDGTVHDVAAGIVGHPVPLGIIATGTANVLAGELGLPRTAEKIAQILCEGRVGTLPVGMANGRPFLFVAGIGFDAEAVRLFESSGNRRLGRAGLALPALRAVFSDEERPLRVETANGTREAHWVIVTRVKRYAANLMLAPDADWRQAAFHVLSMRGSGPLVRMRQLSALAIGCLRYDPGVTLERTDRVRISGDPGTPVQIDGELMGKLPLEISIHPQPINCILPFQSSHSANG